MTAPIAPLYQRAAFVLCVAVAGAILLCLFCLMARETYQAWREGRRRRIWPKGRPAPSVYYRSHGRVQLDSETWGHE